MWEGSVSINSVVNDIINFVCCYSKFLLWMIFIVGYVVRNGMRD